MRIPMLENYSQQSRQILLELFKFYRETFGMSSFSVHSG